MSDAGLPRLADGGTVVCLASGPSLTTEDVAYVRGRATVIAVNDAVRLAPWADVLYSNDSTWWLRNRAWYWDFLGIKVGASRRYPYTGRNRCVKCGGIPIEGVHRCWRKDMVVLSSVVESGVSFTPGAICHLNNSGSAAINVVPDPPNRSSTISRLFEEF